MKYLIHIFTGLSALLIISCGKPELKNGIWSAIVKTESGAEVPFNFALSDSAGKQELYIINASERYKTNLVKKGDDSIVIEIPPFGCEIRAKIGNGKLTGQSIKHLAGKDVVMEFSADQGIPLRFVESSVKPKYNVSGRWAATFTAADGKINNLVGEFKQKAPGALRINTVTGTFLSFRIYYKLFQKIYFHKLFTSTRTPFFPALIARSPLSILATNLGSYGLFSPFPLLTSDLSIFPLTFLTSSLNIFVSLSGIEIVSVVISSQFICTNLLYNLQNHPMAD